MKLVAISDTHWTNARLEALEVPTGDILIHAGDATFRGKIKEWYGFLPWWTEIGKRFKDRIFCPGNHDFNYSHPSHLVTNIENVKFGVMPLVPNLPDWAFAATEEQIWLALQAIGQVDVMITHAPPNNILDRSFDLKRGMWSTHYGSIAIADFLRSKDAPKVHIFGHVHSAQGYFNTGSVKCYNVAICDEDYEMTNPVTEIEI